MAGRAAWLSRAPLNSLPDDPFDIVPLYTERESDAVLREMHSGRTTHAGLYKMIHREVPEALKLYDSLGRFRDPLLVHRWRTESDSARRARLMKIITTFSSCLPN